MFLDEIFDKGRKFHPGDSRKESTENGNANNANVHSRKHYISTVRSRNMYQKSRAVSHG
jgi:hypothetical protein